MLSCRRARRGVIIILYPEFRNDKDARSERNCGIDIKGVGIIFDCHAVYVYFMLCGTIPSFKCQHIVHLEAMKMDLKGLPKPSSTMTFSMKVIGVLTGFLFTAFMFGAVYYDVGVVIS